MHVYLLIAILVYMAVIYCCFRRRVELVIFIELSLEFEDNIYGMLSM